MNLGDIMLLSDFINELNDIFVKKGNVEVVVNDDGIDYSIEERKANFPLFNKLQNKVIL